MQDAIVNAWVRQTPLSGSILESLHHLNHRFLDLLGACGGRSSQPGPIGPTAQVCLNVAPLTPSQKAAAAHCPYALFDLRFEDAEHWRARLARRGEWRIAEEAVLEHETADFLRLALFFAWHLASTSKLGAQLLLGMHERTAIAFSGAPLDCLPPLVASEAAHLSARWCSSAAYWNSLLRAASHADPARLRRVQLFGLQLAAASRLS